MFRNFDLFQTTSLSVYVSQNGGYIVLFKIVEKSLNSKFNLNAIISVPRNVVLWFVTCQIHTTNKSVTTSLQINVLQRINFDGF